MTHFPQMLLITVAFYQLNKYDKVTTVKFQELLQIFWETYSLNSREFFYTCFQTFRLLKNVAFYTKQDYSAISFSHPSFSAGRSNEAEKIITWDQGHLCQSKMAFKPWNRMAARSTHAGHHKTRGKKTTRIVRVLQGRTQ